MKEKLLKVLHARFKGKLSGTQKTICCVNGAVFQPTAHRVRGLRSAQTPKTLRCLYYRQLCLQPKGSRKKTSADNGCR